MPRATLKSDPIDVITARRQTLIDELAAVDEQLRAAETAARDAGRPILLAALERVKIAAMDKADARAIAAAIGEHGGKKVAAHLTSISAE